MAKKSSRTFICNSCGATYNRWQGKCTQCNEWNSIDEDHSAPVVGAGKSVPAGPMDELPFLADINPEETARKTTGLDDLDLVLGGGLVPGQLILLAGEPGVGKSTLILEISRRFTGRIYYFSGEESPGQIRMRSDRMKIDGSRIKISREIELDKICNRMSREKPDLLVIDSVQTISSREGNLPGSPGQLRDAAFSLLEASKRSKVPVLLTGHITKEGSIGGPRLLEHMMDTVLYFESDRNNHYRILKSTKNRFGPVGEAAILEMRSDGMIPAQRLSSTRSEESPAGCVHAVILEGSRPIVVEVQALVTRSAYGPARRVAEGLDTGRLLLLSAVLEKHLKLRLSDYDIFANIAGGFRADEPGLDLALCVAILSSFNEQPVSSHTGVLGEVGLSGELRPASRENLRLKEMSALGFQKLVVSSGSAVEEIQQSHPSISWQRLKSVSEIPGALFAEGGKARETDGQAKALL
ncbi:MAG: DNA repair protein RadA [Leptospiraceae bacterium]